MSHERSLAAVPGPTARWVIFVWAIIGSIAGWLAAACLFLRRTDEWTCLLAALGVALATALYGAWRRRDLYSRIVFSILVGGLLTGLMSPSVSEREPDRSKWIFQGFGPGRFSPIPYGLTGALLFLGVLLVMAPLPGKSETK